MPLEPQRSSREAARTYIRTYMREVYLPRKRRERKQRELEAKKLLKELAPPEDGRTGSVLCHTCHRRYPGDRHRLAHPDLKMLKWWIHQHLATSIFSALDEPIEYEIDQFVAVLSIADARDFHRPRQNWSHTGPYASGKYVEKKFVPHFGRRKKNKTPEPDLTA